MNSSAWERPLIVAWNAPSMWIGDFFAAFNEMDTDERSDIWNPSFRNLSNNYKSDWAPASAIAVASTTLNGHLSRARLIVTWGWAVILTLFHCPLLKIWWSKVHTEVLRDADLVIWPREFPSTREINPVTPLFLDETCFFFQQLSQSTWGSLFHPRAFLE